MLIAYIHKVMRRETDTVRVCPLALMCTFSKVLIFEWNHGEFNRADEWHGTSNEFFVPYCRPDRAEALADENLPAQSGRFASNGKNQLPLRTT